MRAPGTTPAGAGSKTNVRKTIARLLSKPLSAGARIVRALLPKNIVSIHDYERLAESRMSPAAWAYISTGAADELTCRWNEKAFREIYLHQRSVMDISELDARVTLFGRAMPHPILLSPAANHCLAHPEGELETARGAGTVKATMIVSALASHSLEDIARTATQPLWFQSYLLKERERAKDMLQRAEAAGYEVLCITVDQPVQGMRDRWRRVCRPRNGVSLHDYPVDLVRYPVTWQDIEWYRSHTNLPMVIKGIMNPEEADLAIRAGASAVFVSNHGGRNLDTAPATIEVLPEIAETVAGRVPVIFDGGIRRGTDVLKALALGATAVAIGRPYLYGLAVRGAAGVATVVNILRNELEMAMALTGRTCIAALDRSVILNRPGQKQ
jgi:4-hydroxymandelate oxidase